MMPPYKHRIQSLGGLWKYIPVVDEDGTDALTAFHRKLIADSASLYEQEKGAPFGLYSVVESGQYIHLAYALEGGGTEARGYSVSDRYLRESNEFARLLSSASVKEYLSIESLLGYDVLETPELYYGERYGMKTVSLDTDVREKLTGEALRELAVRLDEDYRAMSANDMLHPGNELFTLYFSSYHPAGVTYSNEHTALSGKGEPSYEWVTNYDGAFDGASLPYTVTEKSVRTIAWLKELGVYDSIVETADELKRSYEQENKEMESE
jgi:hypothetical protein